MHVNVRLLTGQTTILDVGEGATIATLKDAFAEEYIRETIKFIFKGKTMMTETTLLNSFILAENDAVVLVGKKKSLHTTVKKAPQQATMAEEFKAARHIGSSDRPGPKQPTPNTSGQTGNASVSDEVVQSIVSMGFDKEFVIEALQKAMYNPDLAVEYCLSGIPQSPYVPAGEPFDPLDDHSGTGTASSEDLLHLQNLLSGQASNEMRETELTQALRSIPNFEEIRLMSLGNAPSLIPAVIDEMEKSHPEVHRLIQREPEQFMRAMAHGLPRPPTAAREGETVRVDPEPIQRLMNIGGFSQEQATKAYILANRNEDMAASILFEALEQQMMGAENGSN
ncbi:UBA/TS-N domain containing protein [Perkinsela sp. CCAP 1560/4]|nr:UBA/TS-N domain containing protein [Perkinsela sp. CCAP 1560/4]|eukprot:KNH04957.1 UBA/TS-N domain containing protein [Perkinsela sp. CCAP 1560/4]